jgi:Nickel/cobalt transporter regulator
MAREQQLRRDNHRDGDSSWSGNRDGDRHWDGDRDGSHRRWSSDWRRDHRYDWHKHRHRHGSLYRLGRYYDPYGWGYRRFSIGFSLWPSYYGSSFWMNDPWQYRLPPAYGPYRWVRYYNDALLVNIYTGQVVDVIYSFFW